jgi:hypothetical protein
MRLREKSEKKSNGKKGQRTENLLGDKELSCNCQKIMMTKYIKKPPTRTKIEA